MSKVKISVIIPTFNRAEYLAECLDSLLEQTIKPYQIIVVNNGSNDNTLGVVPKDRNISILRNETNRGKGHSIKKGVLKSKNDLILFMDSDLATPMKELDNLYAYIKNGYDVVIASRALKQSIITVKQPKYRQLAGQTFPFLVRFLTPLSLKDTQCGFKLLKRAAAQKIFKRLTIDRFAFDVEMLYIAQKLGYKIAEVPVTWIDQKGSKVKIIRDSIKMFFDLIKIRLNDFLGKYN